MDNLKLWLLPRQSCPKKAQLRFSIVTVEPLLKYSRRDKFSDKYLQHGCVLQLNVSVLSPGHPAPPPDGGGESHIRLRVVVPVLHFLVQEDHEVHIPH